jgi:DHA1 family multidrug/chloramphenicol efflux transport protein-like MFS transporter
MTKLVHHLFLPLLLVFYEVATYLSNDMYLPALPNMMTDLHLSAKQVQLSLTWWFVGQACFPFVVGALSDRLGRRLVLLSGGVVYILATILCALATRYDVLLIGRFIEGGMVAAMLVPAYACIHESFEKKEAIRILALMGSVSVLAPALGPLVGGFILLVGTWRDIFWVIAVMAIIAIGLLYRSMPETLPVEKRQPLHLGTLLKGYYLVLVNRRYMMLMSALGFVYAGFIAWISAGPLLVIDDFQRSPVEFGVIQLIVFAVYIFGSTLVKYLMEWLGVLVLVQFGLGCSLLGGILVYLTAYFYPTLLYPFIVAFLIFSFGAALCFAPLNRMIIESSNEIMGIRVAFFTMCITIYGALGSAAASLFFNGSVKSLAILVSAAVVLSCACKLAADLRLKAVHS